ncbi:hypothetical protein [Noviherbaspirillum humi]|uniref:hypothetical protein n=1 Tax=Noviherbaspirillum humi TaxID=1688639 RepID=UPI0011603702|nr:hypothetical protein [Noviherbaspirillum humi]
MPITFCLPLQLPSLNSNEVTHPLIGLNNASESLKSTPSQSINPALAASRLGCSIPMGTLKINGEEYAKFVTRSGKDACFISLSDPRHQYLIRSYEDFQNPFRDTGLTEGQYAPIAIAASSYGYRHFDRFMFPNSKGTTLYGVFRTANGKEKEVLIE